MPAVYGRFFILIQNQIQTASICMKQRWLFFSIQAGWDDKVTMWDDFENISIF